MSAIQTELVVKIASGGAGQTVRDVLGVQKAIATLGKDAKDTAALAKKLGQEFNLPDDQVQALADALGQAKTATEGAAEAAGTYRNAMGRLVDANGRFVKEAVDGFDQVGRKAGGLSNIFEGVFQGIGQQLTKVGFEALNATLATVGSTIKSAIGEFERFELALVSFDAKSTASQEQIKAIGDQAKELAAVTSQSPAGVAELATALLTLGATADEVEDNLRGITFLADVLGEDPVLTGQVVQTGINIFGEFGETADSLSDKLNFLVNNSAAGAQGGLSEFFQLFADVGGIVGSTGAQFDDLASTFAVLRGGGASASIAATSIKTALLALSGPTTEANAKLKELGVSAFDSEGTFRGLGVTLEDFEKAMDGLSQQQQLELATTIFGREGAPGFLAGVKNASGGIAELRGQLATQADGSLAESLETINQALTRQAGLLQGNIEGALTSFGEALAPIKLAAVQFANSLIAASIEGSDGLGALTEAAERFGLVLTQNPEIVESLGAALAKVADAGVQQLSLLIDTITGLIADEENIELIASAFEDLATAVQLAGQGARFIVAITTTLIDLRRTIREIPVLGDILKFNPTDLIGAFKAVGNAIRNAAEFVANLVNRFDFLANNPVIKAILSQVLETEASVSSLGSTLGSSLTGAATSLGQAGAEVQKNLQAVADSAEDAGDRTAAAAETIEDALKRLGAANKNSLADLQTTAANARAAILEAGGDPAKLAALEAKSLRDRIQQNRDFLKELEALQSKGGLSAEDAAAVADQIRQVDGQLASDRVSLAQNTLSEKKRIEKEAADAAKKAADEARKAAEAKAKTETDALKKVRDEEKRVAEQRQADAEKAAQREFGDARDGRTEAREAQRREEDKAAQKTLQESDRAYQAQRRQSDKAAQEQAQARADAFQKSQQAAAEAFQKRLDAERDKGNREFDALGSEVDKRLQLAQADKTQRAELLKQFEEERKTLELRRQIEKEVLAQRGSVLAGEDLSLSPLEQARADFEAQLQAKAAAFQEGQQAQSQAFQESQAVEAEARAEALRLEDEARADERAAAEDARAEARRAEDKAFEESERQLQDDFEAQQRSQKEAFNSQQRQLDEASAQRIAAILAAAKPAGIDGARKDGGPVRGGGTYLVGEEGPELVTMRRGGYVHTARETAAMMAGVTGRGTAVTVAQPSTGAVEAKLDRLISVVEQGRRVQPGGNIYNLNTPEPIQDAIAIQLEQLRQMVRGGGL